MFKKINFKSNDNKAAMLFIAPSFIGISIFVLIPFIETVRNSFYNAIGDKFVSLDNYASVFANPAFRLASFNTAKFITICVPILLVASLLIALMVKSISPSGKKFETAFLIPMAIPVASIALLWQVLFSINGLVNTGLLFIGASPVDFMGSNTAFWVLIFTYVWKNSGYTMILWLAGMDGIPQSLYEAASVDGANKLQQFRAITLPNILPTAILATILSIINTFKVFREAYLVAGNYPHESIYMLQHLFNNWFRELDLGRVTAGAVIMAMVLLVFILVLQRFWNGDD